jgi:undecaprenyl-diphosphatase
MTWWDGILLGLVQGLTEFLPVSSSGHLVVVEAVLGVHTPGVVVEVVLHVATELVIGAARRDRGALGAIGLLVMASIPAGVIGVLFKDWFERVFDSLLVVGVDFLVTGLVLWSTTFTRPGTRVQPSVRGATGVGFAQAFAILPGISRSGSTVAAGIWAGVDPVRAAEFSFLMAMPAIAGAAVLQLPELRGGATAVGLGPLVASFITALVSGVLAIRLLVRLLARRAFHRFAPYCWAIGALTIGWVLLRP